MEDSFPFRHNTETISSTAPYTTPAFLLPHSSAQQTLRTNSVDSQPQQNQIPISSTQEQTLVTPNSNSASESHNSVSHSTIPTQTTTNQHPMVTRLKTGSLKPRNRLNLLHQYSDNTLSEPTTFRDAYKSMEWRHAMATEFSALQKQGTWILVPPPSSSSILGCRWTFRTKRHTNGSVARYKARLVAQGNHQEHGVDYLETFSPVAKLPTVRILITIALFHNWTIRQFDVENAFLHGKLSETVYMKQPKGFEDTSHPDHVCLLQKAIYGLKQAPRQWYNTFTEHVLALGFQHSMADPSLLTYKNNDTRMYLLVYVDDILITGNNSEAISNLISKLAARFNLKDLGLANQFLGISIHYANNSYFLSQKSYALSILQQVEMEDCKGLANPTCTKIPSEITTDVLLSNPATFRRITGSLQYLTLTRPDIAFAVNVISQNMHNPLNTHCFLLKRILRYIRGTLDFGIPVTKSDLKLRSFSDADWAGDPATRKSTTGFCTFLGQTLVSWAVKKQKVVARSSTESEYRALAAATTDLIWIKRLLADFDIAQDNPAELFCDNTSAIALANNPVFHARTKHIEIDQKFIRDQIQQNNIRLLPICSVDQVADIFTKHMSTPRFQYLRLKLTIVNDPSVCGGILEDKHINI
ncbi:Retrovirus-related Pol polyprotein from transposon TNT 1-94 [Dendrobium catenatum]|uniref:Retrovirus-related Pol polyprotein from transposon TNT 1-94 n=1 Tax=Dendrobium catenatum TaxID=906689 RepID=A0A2I0WRR3_9ASPA|nr:Retrovirus-related Pol polyprotein from transposon TNT 1-94 [Dendrobium catenatum]